MAIPVRIRVLQFVKDFIAEKGYAPSLVEIATGIGISANSISLISRNIHALVKEGKLKYERQGYRNLQVVESLDYMFPVMQDNFQGMHLLDRTNAVDLSGLLASKHHFLVQAQDDFVTEDGILKGDFIICKKTQDVQEGEMVVACIDGKKNTLKRLSYQIPDHITLFSSDAAVKPKAYPSHRIRIQGVYTGLLRLHQSE
ncbi:MAG: hypothetical protein H0W64_04625 [Gammaproteobacteria bacterium]|nr:hypothetical protein [Gammaproteobacteria bacterium]